MSLFPADPGENLLPQDGVVNYYGPIMPHGKADEYFQKLVNQILWKHDEVTIYGKHYITNRKTAWYGDKPFEYTYSNTTKKAEPWTPELLKLKTTIEQLTGTTYNSCLLNLYHDGNEGMGWHSDDEVTLAKNAAIASMSFGAERKFSLKHKQTKEVVSLLLENGSLLVMKGETQKHWLHSIPKSVKVKSPRVNLTFRTFTG